MVLVTRDPVLGVTATSQWSRGWGGDIKQLLTCTQTMTDTRQEQQTGWGRAGDHTAKQPQSHKPPEENPKTLPETLYLVMSEARNTSELPGCLSLLIPLLV